MKILNVADDSGLTYGAIISLSSIPAGVNFVSSENEEFQSAVMHHPVNHSIKRHYHPKQLRKIQHTSESIILISGELAVDFYSEKGELLETFVAIGPSLIILYRGGHGFKAMTEVTFVEIKQGPYDSKKDKVHF